MKNCLTMLIALKVSGMPGKISILGWNGGIPHFALIHEDLVIHYQAYDKRLPLWQLVSYKGEIAVDINKHIHTI